MPIAISMCFPCLNEEQTLPACIAEFQRTMLRHPEITYEIVVADNGSSDNSVTVATAAGARVVNVGERGYGAALRGAFAAAAGEYAVFADADGSYPLELVPAMYAQARATNSDMVIASRLRGDIAPGAMPPLHRYLGTPVLTWFINTLYHGRISDCNSGFRLLKLSSYAAWHTTGCGMEFASELLIKALKHNAKITEIPGALRRDLRNRPPHLKTWRDGMRHLLFILSEKPSLFEHVGFYSVLIATILQTVSFISGCVDIAGINIFGIHTQIVLLATAVAGVNFYLTGCTLFALLPPGGDDCAANIPEKKMRITAFLIHMSEDNLFFSLLTVFLMMGGGILAVTIRWWLNGFALLNQPELLLFLLHIFIVTGSLAFGLLGLHVMKNRIAVLQR